MELGESNAYKNLYRSKSNTIQGYEMMSDKSFKVCCENDMAIEGAAPTFLQRVISLPNDRVFMVGGSSDVNCSNTKKDTYEMVKDPVTSKRKAEVRTQMWQPRAAFGIAVYPNFSQNSPRYFSLGKFASSGLHG